MKSQPHDVSSARGLEMRQIRQTEEARAADGTSLTSPNSSPASCAIRSQGVSYASLVRNLSPQLVPADSPTWHPLGAQNSSSSASASTSINSTKKNFISVKGERFPLHKMKGPKYLTSAFRKH